MNEERYPGRSSRQASKQAAILNIRSEERGTRSRCPTGREQNESDQPAILRIRRTDGLDHSIYTATEHPANLASLPQQVTYFKKWRVQDIQKRARLKELEAQGAVKMDVNTEFKQ